MVVTHTGCTLPYQLHCSRQTPKLLLVELATEETEEDLDEDDTGTEETTDDATEEATEEVAPEHTVPLMVGVSRAPPFLLSWKPKLAFAPGCKVPFQLRLLAV